MSNYRGRGEFKGYAGRRNNNNGRSRRRKGKCTVNVSSSEVCVNSIEDVPKDSATSIISPKVRRSYVRGERERLESEFIKPERGEKFVEKIKEMLGIVLPSDEIGETAFFAPDNLEIFECAFTHIKTDPEKNYEALEFYGDAVLGSCIAKYLFERFPRLLSMNGRGVNLASHLKVKLQSCQVFSRGCLWYGLDKFIWVDKYHVSDEEKVDSVYEDVFEAFVGALVVVASKMGVDGVGLAYGILKKYFDSLDIGTDYCSVFDPRSQLKELLEYNFKTKDHRWLKSLGLKDNSTTLDVVNTKHVNEDTGLNVIMWKAKVSCGGKRVAEAQSKNKTEAVNVACLNAIDVLLKMGLVKSKMFDKDLYAEI